MAKNVAEFGIKLDADGTIGPAKEAADALNKLRTAIQNDTKEIAAMERALRTLKRGGLEGGEQFKKLKEQLDLKRASLARSQESYLKLGGALDAIGKKRAPRQELNALTEATKRLPAPLASVVTQLSAFVAGGAAAKAIALRVAFIALAVGVAVATAALLKYGIAQSDASRTELLQLEGLARIRDWYGRAADSGTALQSAVDQVTASSALGRGEVVKYTSELYRMGMRGQQLQTALEGVALVASTQGDGQARLFMSMAAGANAAGTSVKKLTDDAKARLGDLGARQMLRLDVQFRKMRESISYIFSGLKIEGFLKSLSAITSLFSQNEATGQAMKAIFEALFQPLVNGFDSVGPLAKRFFQGVTIAALHATIVFLKIRNAIMDAFDVKVLDSAEKVRLALAAGVAVGGALVVVLTAIAVKSALIIAPYAAIAAVIVAAGLAGYKFGQMLIWAAETAMNIDWAYLGTSIWEGIVGGIKSGLQWVKDAMSNLASAGWSAFKEKLGIASPSKVMMETSLEAPRGAALGIEQGIPEVERAAESMAEVVPGALQIDDASSPEGASGRQGAVAPVSISIGEITIQSGATSSSELAKDFKEQLALHLGDVLGTFGAAPV